MKQFGAIALLLIISFVLSACGPKELENTLGWKVDDFTYTSHENKSVSLSDYEGKVWIADLIFTSCNTVCPPMTRNMAKLQEKLKQEKLDVEIVSFSVDPEVDTPQMLKEFGEVQGAELDNWTFLIGYSQEEITDLAANSFKATVLKPEGEEQVTHGTSFYLIGKEGKVMKKYSGYQDVPYDQIVNDVKILSK